MVKTVNRCIIWGSKFPLLQCAPPPSHTRAVGRWAMKSLVWSGFVWMVLFQASVGDRRDRLIWHRRSESDTESAIPYMQGTLYAGACWNGCCGQECSTSEGAYHPCGICPTKPWDQAQRHINQSSFALGMDSLAGTTAYMGG